MENTVSLTKECKNNLVNIKGKRFNEVTDLSEEELARFLKINRELFSMYTNWYVIDDELYYFKRHFIFNELLLSELAREFNVKCVDFKLATDGEHIGVISKNFRKRESLYSDYLEFAIKYFITIPENLASFKANAYAVFGDKVGSKLTNQVFDLVAFDFFSGQNDRTHINVAFETRCRDVAKLAPLCDNGVAFTTSDFNTHVSCFGDLYFPFDNCIDSRQLELLKLIRDNASFYNSLLKALKVDTNEVLDRTLEKYKLKMSTRGRIKLNDYFGSKKDVIERSLTYSSKI